MSDGKPQAAVASDGRSQTSFTKTFDSLQLELQLEVMHRKTPTHSLDLTLCLKHYLWPHCDGGSHTHQGSQETWKTRRFIFYLSRSRVWNLSQKVRKPEQNKKFGQNLEITWILWLNKTGNPDIF